MADVNSNVKTDKALIAAIAAVHLEMEGARGGALAASVGAGIGVARTGREGWKMAGRAERLGLSPSDKPFSGKA